MDQFMFETEDSIRLKAVYDRLQDDESREIYCARSLFSLSDDSRYMNKIINNMSLSKKLYAFIEKKHGKKTVLFGAGTWGKAIIKHLDLKWDYVVDNFFTGKTIQEYKVCHIDDVVDADNTIIVLSILFKYRDVVKQLSDKGFKKENILVLGELATELQYFDLPQLSFGKDEIYVDAGGFNGDTALRFNSVVNGKYEHIYVFEPNSELYSQSKAFLSSLKSCDVINKATWSEECRLSIIEAGEGTRIVENGADGVSIEATSIDKVLNGSRATYIKMDIEGAEMEALLGAESTIKKHKPKLAISVYHKRNDIWEIPKLLLNYNSDYKFYLRIYSFTGNDTVLYAL